MHMWMWFGYDLGDFLFSGLIISTRWAFALTWIALFFVALLFEGSKVYLAKVQREAHNKLYPYRSDERRNLLCDRERGAMEPTTSRNTTTAQVSRWGLIKVRALVNAHQSVVFLAHNVVGYLLMLAVMVYNVHLLLAVVFGMMLGYFLFGPKLTRLQMQCHRTKRVVICTPECDDTAETSTPPLLNHSESDSDFYNCQTRTCIQPSHYFPSTSQDGASTENNVTCQYGAKKCPSKVARAKKAQCHSEKEDNSNIEDTKLLVKERSGCCKSEPPHEEKCCKKEIVVVQEPTSCCKKEKVSEEQAHEETREKTPPVTCCKSSSTESREQIVHP
ncbi:uncharacterized protein LOC101736188 isoform X2 [Bombyx mori]|nr:uncharacterized protein LOC101736188 isoform X2 [Bombyx mori]